MAEPSTVVRRGVVPSKQPIKTVCPGSNPGSVAAAGAEAFRECRPDLKDFILELENRLYSKKVISNDTHDIINDIHGSSIVQRRQILLDSVESWLRLADSGAEFDVILDLFKEDPAHCNVAERLSQARETCLATPPSPSPPPPPLTSPQEGSTAETQPTDSAVSHSGSKSPEPLYSNWIFASIFTAIIATVVFYYITTEKENSSTTFLKEKYNTLNLMLGPSYSSVPYTHLSIFQYPDPDWKTKSHEPHNMSSQPVSVEELLNVGTGDRILIVGGPGTGKTRLTLEIMRLWANNKVLLSCELLFVYRLRWFSLQKKDIDLKSIVSMHMEGGPVVDEIVNEAISTGGKRLCFLFDGLDEYEPGYSDIDNYVFLLMHRQALSNAVVIVTTRNITSTGFEAIEWTRRYHVTGFSNEQLKSYFQSYFMQTGKNFTNFVAMHSNLWQMCKIPLHVSLLLNTFGSKTMDTTIFTATELFEEITIRTFESDLRKAYEPGKTIIFKDLKHLLLEFPIFAKVCALAFKGSLNRQYSFLDSEVPLELKWTNLSYFQIEPYPGAWNMEVYTFIHQSLMDFLAAVHLTSLSESKQLRPITELCWTMYRYDDFWKFVCGLTSYFTPLYTTLHDCYRLHWLGQMKMAHCIYEAQSHSPHEIQPAAQHFMKAKEGNLTFMFTTLTAYDMQAIGFVVSSSPRDFKNLLLFFVTVADGDRDLSFLFYSLAKPRVVFSSLEWLYFAHLYGGMKADKAVIDFFKHTPDLSLLMLIDVSEPLLRLASLAPQSCTDIYVYDTYISTSSTVTPYSLIENRHETNVFHLAKCNISDNHLFAMRSTPWSINVTFFGLSHNYIGNEGAISLATSIQNNRTRTEYDTCGPAVLDLKFNNVSGEGLVAILKAADAVCSKLTFVDLTGNNVKDNEVESIIKSCHTLSMRLFPIAIKLLGNSLTEGGETKLKLGLSGSLCYVLFEFESAWSKASYFENIFQGFEEHRVQGQELEAFKEQFINALLLYA